MDKKEANTTTTTTTTATQPLGMCEKLFNALNTNNTLRPLRRLTFKQQDAEPQSGTHPNNIPATADHANHKTTPSLPPQEKPKVASTAPFVPKKDAKVTQNAMPTPVPPKGAVMPQPAPPIGTGSTHHAAKAKPKKTINEKVEDYINRTKGKLNRTQTNK